MTSIRLKKPISEEVYNIIKSKILSNDLIPGQRLVETDIAQKLKVSRTPIREALKQLEHDGLITYYPRRGSVVSEMSIDDAIAIYEVREALESLAVRLLCMNVTRKDIKLLEQIVLDMEDSIQKEEFEILKDLHGKWTDAIIQLTTNNYLKNQMITLYENLGRLRKVSLFNVKHSLEAYKETKATLQSVIDGDEKESEKLAKIHVRNARKRFMENVIEK